METQEAMEKGIKALGDVRLWNKYCRWGNGKNTGVQLKKALVAHGLSTELFDSVMEDRKFQTELGELVGAMENPFQTEQGNQAIVMAKMRQVLGIGKKLPPEVNAMLDKAVGENKNG